MPPSALAKRPAAGFCRILHASDPPLPPPRTQWQCTTRMSGWHFGKGDSGIPIKLNLPLESWVGGRSNPCPYTTRWFWVQRLWGCRVAILPTCDGQIYTDFNILNPNPGREMEMQRLGVMKPRITGHYTTMILLMVQKSGQPVEVGIEFIPYHLQFFLHHRRRRISSINGRITTRPQHTEQIYLAGVWKAANFNNPQRFRSKHVCFSVFVATFRLDPWPT